MTSEEIESSAREVLAKIVPEFEPGDLDPKVAFRDQFEIDSIDYLNFVLSLEKALGVKIPEMDYPKLASLNGCVAYLSERFGTRGA